MATGTTDLPDFTKLNFAPIFFTFLQYLTLLNSLSFGHPTSLSVRQNNLNNNWELFFIISTERPGTTKSQELPEIHNTEMKSKKEGKIATDRNALRGMRLISES